MRKRISFLRSPLRCEEIVPTKGGQAADERLTSNAAIETRSSASGGSGVKQIMRRGGCMLKYSQVCHGKALTPRGSIFVYF